MMDEKEDQFLDEEEMLDDDEKFYAEMFERLMEYAYPNPDRIGCPDPQILRDLAFRRKVAPEIFDEVLTHMMECAPCCQQARVYADEYKQTTTGK